jgi:hypothetical protein
MQRSVRVSIYTFVAAAAVASHMSAASANEDWFANGSIGDRFGVQVKGLTTSAEDLDAIKAAGFGLVRYVIDWSYVEKKRGLYQWDEFDSFNKQVRARKLRSIIVLIGGNAAYSGELEGPRDARNGNRVSKLALAPKEPQAVSGFAQFAEAAVSRYGGDDISWEIWNEPDLDYFWPPRTDREAYTILATYACKAIRKKHSTARIIGPAAASMPGWRDRLGFGLIAIVLKSPLKSCLNAVSFHSYRGERGVTPKSPESVMVDNARALSIVAELASPAPALPLVCSEWGYNSLELSEAEQASYVLRTYFANVLSGVPITVWYEWRDSVLESDNTEAHFGLVDMYGKEKPAVPTIRTVLPLIKDDRLERRLQLGDPKDFALLLASSHGNKKLVIWTSRTQNEGSVQIQLVGQKHIIRLTPTPQVIDVGPTIPQVTVTQNKL